MLIVTGLLGIAPDRIDELRPHIVELIAASRREAGCRLYAWGEDFVEPGVIRMIEHWDDWAAFEEHDASAHAAKWKAALAPIGLLRREMWAYDGINERSI